MSSAYNNAFVYLSQQLIETVGKELNNSERAVFSFILHRTLRYNKQEERIPMRHFMEGVVSSEGVSVTAPIPGNKRTIRRTLDSLISKGFIAVRIGKDYFGTNHIKVLVDNVKEFIKMCALNISKKYKEGKENKESEWGSKRVNGGGQKESAYKGSDLIEGSDLKEQENSNSSSIENVMLSVVKQTEKVKMKSRVKRKKILLTNPSFSGSAFTRLWNASFAEFAEKHNILATRLTNSETCIAGKSFKNNPIFTKNDWSIYLIDVLTNWNEYAHHLTKRSNHRVPEYPNFNYFSKHRNRFQAVYQEERTGKVLVIGSEAHDIERLEKENEKLRGRVDNLKQESKLQSIATHNNYLDKVIQNGGVISRKSKNKKQQKISLNPVDTFAEENW